MTRSSGTRTGRSLLAAGGALLFCVAALRAFEITGAAALAAVRESGPDAPADLLVLGAAAVGLLLVTWLGVGVLLAILATLPGAAGRFASVAADRIAPPLVRRVTAVLLGTTLAATGTPLAHAAEPAPAPATVQVVVAPAPDPAFGVTVRASVAEAPAARRDIPPTPAPAPDPAFGASDLGPLGPAPETTSSPPGTVTVALGDSLWAIAARHLGSGATRRQIAHEWPRWYAANRAVIGPNPNLIRVGQALTAPGATS
jgi:LysM repeat protein